MRPGDPRGAIGVIVGMSPDRVIGRNNRIPWRSPADQRRFRRLTLGGTVIMGRLTYDSIGRPLSGRINIVLTRGPPIPGVQIADSLESALELGAGPRWVLGGVAVFQEALQGLADFVDITHIPEHPPVRGSLLFPQMDPERWIAGPLYPNPEAPELWHQRFTRRSEPTRRDGSEPDPVL